MSDPAPKANHPAPKSSAQTTEPHSSETEQALPVLDYPLTPAAILQLQRTIGNRAVQRALAYFKPDGKASLTPDHAKLDVMAQAIDKKTDEAHAHTLGKLQASTKGGKLDAKDFPASSDKRFTDWLNKLQGSNDNLKRAATGYIIEDVVSAAFSGKDGFTPQYVTGEARPDFLIEDDEGKRGVVDITSDFKPGHVLDKAFDQASFGYITESLYPAFNFDNIDASSISVDPSTLADVAKIRAQRADTKFRLHLVFMKKTIDNMIGAPRGVYPMLPRPLPSHKKKRKVKNITVLEVAKATGLLLTKMRSEGITKERLAQLTIFVEFLKTSQKVATFVRIPNYLELLRNKYGVTGDPPWADD